MSKVFLGGTVNANWRELLIERFQTNVKYFNPIVENWDNIAQEIEQIEKDICNIHFYCITSEMSGVYSIAEVIDSVHNKSKSTILQIIPDNFPQSQLRSLEAVVKLINLRGGLAYIDSDLGTSATLISTLFDYINFA